MNHFRKFTSRPIFMWLIVLFGLLGVFAFVNPPHAAADYSCGVNNNGNGPGNNHQAAGIVVDVNWHPYGGSSLVDDNTSQVQVTTNRTDGFPVKQSPGPLPGHQSGGVAQMSADDNQELSLNDSMTFNQVPAGCAMYPNSNQAYNGGNEVVLGYGTTSSASGTNNWALDCEEIIRFQNGATGSTIYQPYTITGVGVPAGARAGGQWSVQQIQPINGNTTYVTVTYYEPAPPQPQPPTGSCTFLEASNTGNYFGQRKRTHVQISGTNHDTDEYIPGAGGAGPGNTGTVTQDYHYWPQRNDISVTVTTEYLPSGKGTSWTPIGGSTHIRSYGQPCFSASCSNLSVDGDGPGGIVLAGGNMYVHGTFTNTSPGPDSLPMYAGAFLDGPNGANNLGFVPYAGYPVNFMLKLTAPSAVQTYGASFTPQYNGSESFMSGCSMSVSVYQQFSATVSAQSDVSPTIENPTSDSYGATISHQWVNPPAGLPGHGINNPVSTSFYQKKAGGGQTTPCSPSSYSSSGPYNVPSPAPPGYDTIWSHNCTVAPGSFAAGDEFCSAVTAQYGSGYVGPDGNVAFGGPSASDTKCPRVVNEPYFKVYNSDISAGGDFDKCTTNGGTLAGYADISDPSGATRGSTTQLSALALLKITGVASAKTSANITGSPTKLSFANAGVQVDSGGNESPVLGGQFGGCRTLTNETAPDSAKNLGGASTGVVPPTGSGAYTHTGNLTITGGTLGANQNVSMFVTGNVYISNDITYGNGWQAGTAPSFIVHATGNVYIAPGVKKLSGVYIAQQGTKSDGSPDTATGKIYTCADSTGFAPMSAANLYNGCKNQLVVYGSFVADQVNLMRSFGSLRDEIPNPGTPGSPGISGSAGIWSCGGGSCNPSLSGYNCIHTNEPGDPDKNYGWSDNQLCLPSGSSLKMAWTYYATNPATTYTADQIKAGEASIDYLKNNGYRYCTPWTPKARDGTTDDANWGIESSGGSVYSNQLCLSQDIGLTFGTNPNPPGQACLKIYEPADPLDNWASGYYLCAPVSAGTPPTPPTPKSPPYTCSNGASLAPVTCAGEIFEYSPALYLSNGGIIVNPPGGGSLQLQSITSLPPVL